MAHGLLNLTGCSRLLYIYIVLGDVNKLRAEGVCLCVYVNACVEECILVVHNLLQLAPEGRLILSMFPMRWVTHHHGILGRKTLPTSTYTKSKHIRYCLLLYLNQTYSCGIVDIEKPG